jgi:ADP-ribose pyrophosphatase
MSEEARTSTLLTRKSIWPGKTVKLDLERVVLPGGVTTELEIVHHPGAACVLPLLSDGRLLLIRQYRHAVGRDLLEAPAGKLDPGEAPEACAARELEEETGWVPGTLEPTGVVHTTPGFCDEVIHLFVARDLREGTMKREESELMTLEPTTVADALAAIADGRLTDGKTIVALAQSHLRGMLE